MATQVFREEEAPKKYMFIRDCIASDKQVAKATCKPCHQSRIPEAPVPSLDAGLLRTSGQEEAGRHLRML